MYYASKNMGYTDHNKFLMFGDSITEYAFNQFPQGCEQPQYALGAALQQAYVRKLQVVQRGFSGYTSRDALPLAKSILKAEHDDVPESQKIKIAYCFFGTNDARLRGTSDCNAESIPLDLFLENMKKTVEEFRARNIPLIVITPGLHDSKLWDNTHPEDLKTGDYRTNERNKLYQDKLREAIPEIPMVMLYDVMAEWMGTNSKLGWDDLSELLYDGIHLSGEGYRLLFNELMSTIRNYYPEVHPDNLEFKFPDSKTLTEDTFANIE